MDFSALMQQYSAEKVAGEDSLPPTAQQQPSNVPPQQPQRRHAHRRMRDRQPHRPEGVVDALGGGEYKLVNLFGKYKLWEDDWFCEPDDLVILFEAKADNDVTVGLTSEKEVANKSMYEIVIGGWKNTKAVIRTEAQGQERAVAFDPRLCNGDTFLSYWVVLQDGEIAAGVGDKPGHNVLIAWSNVQYNPEDLQPCWVTFTSWDSPVHLRKVRTQRASQLGYDWREVCGPTMTWKDRFVPAYIQAFEAERAENITRAERFGVEFVPPDPSRALTKLTHEQRELARAAQTGRLRQGFATGFDVTKPEEVAARQARAARFGIEGAAAPAPTPQAALLLSDEDLVLKRARAERFGVPLAEQVRLAELSSKLPVKPREASEEESQRIDTLHVFTEFRGLSSSHVLRAFNGFDPTRVEWLNDCSCNVCFADEFTAKRALDALTREIPPPIVLPEEVSATSEVAMVEAELKRLIASKWRMGALLDPENKTRYLLVRPATTGDVKEFIPKEDLGQKKRGRWAPLDE